MADPVTSNISVTQVGTSVRNRKPIYTATKVTKTQTNPPQYKTEIIRYSDAKGNNPVTIGERSSENGKIVFNDNASATEKRYTARLGDTSTGQIDSISSSITSTASDKAALNKTAGKSNQALGSGVSTQPQGQQRPVGGQGGRKSRYSSGVNNKPTGSGDSTASAKPIGAASEDKPGTRSKFPNLIFPVGLGNVDRDVIKFDMIKYIPTGFGMGSGDTKSLGGSGGRKTGGKSIGSVILPIPGGISDTNAVDWGSGTMNPIQAAAANIALKTLQDGFAAGADAAVKIGEEAKNAGPDVKKGIASFIAGSATQIGKQALQRGEGMVLNPNMELLFNGPQLRNFGFSFKLSPRNAREAQEVVKIIKFFKQGMSPIRSKSNFFLKAPHTFNLRYIKGRSNNKDQKFLNKFKECALTNATVQYTPDGNYNTFTDGVMASYSLQLTFSELTPVYNDDYGSGSFDPSIGF
jgi:hypothetical protein